MVANHPDFPPPPNPHRSPQAEAPLFYLQDSRSYVGNDVLWWAKGGRGYTTDLSKAEVYSLVDAQAQHNMRHSDIPWPKAYIDGKTRPAVDVQYIKRDEALAGIGIVLINKQKKYISGGVIGDAVRPPLQPGESYRCGGCGRLMSERQFWIGKCSHCGTDSRP